MPPEENTLTPDPAPVDPAVVAAGDPPPADPPAPEPPADPPAPEPAKAQTPKWAIDEITKLRAEKRDADARAEREAAARRDAEALAQRLQNGGKEPPATPSAPAAPSQDQYQRDVETAAARQLMGQDIATVANTGTSEFRDWNEKTNILAAVGAASPEFVLDVIAVDKANAHKILYGLANDPEKAAQLASMDPRRRIAELTRIAAVTEKKPAADPKPAAPVAPEPKAVSKVPAPKPPMEPLAPAAKDWTADDVSDEEFSRGWDQKYKRRPAA